MAGTALSFKLQNRIEYGLMKTLMISSVSYFHLGLNLCLGG